MGHRQNPPNKPKPGPTPETIKVEGDVDWKDALRHAMSKPKPERDEVEPDKKPKDKGQQD